MRSVGASSSQSSFNFHNFCWKIFACNTTGLISPRGSNGEASVAKTVLLVIILSPKCGSMMDIVSVKVFHNIPKILCSEEESHSSIGKASSSLEFDENCLALNPPDHIILLISLIVSKIRAGSSIRTSKLST